MNNKKTLHDEEQGEGINLSDLKKSLEEYGMGDISIGENTFLSAIKTVEKQQHSDNSIDNMSVDTTMLLDEYDNNSNNINNNLKNSNTFQIDPNDPVQSEKERFQEYCRKQLEALTCIRKEVLRDDQDTLDMEQLSKFQFWNKMLQKERQAHAEEVAELRLEIRELQGILDEIHDQIFLVFGFSFML